MSASSNRTGCIWIHELVGKHWVFFEGSESSSPSQVIENSQLFWMCWIAQRRNFLLYCCVIQTSDKIVKEAIIGLCKTKGLELERLSLVGCTLITDESILAVSKGCRNIKSLDLSSTKITDSSMKYLTGCVSIEKLKFDVCLLSNFTATKNSSYVLLFEAQKWRNYWQNYRISSILVCPSGDKNLCLLKLWKGWPSTYHSSEPLLIMIVIHARNWRVWS